jgi:transcriptional regulator with PAS, ATPase and Fis domain
MNEITLKELTGPLPKSIKLQLQNLGIQFGTNGNVCISIDTIPKSEPGQPWLLITTRAATNKQLIDAKLKRVLDVICLEDQNAALRIKSRCVESLLPLDPIPSAPEFVAQSAAAKKLLRHLHQAAQTSMPVLLTGETGTGKELASRLIHQWSTRRNNTFVPINCSAIPNELMEGELFGYVKGAFSGASRDYDGQLVAGEGGTVFLDEIDDTPSSLQTKLLRVLEDKVVSRLGENVWRKIDFRIIAATNRDLKIMIQKGQFGDDLYERFSTVEIVLPSLKERSEDLLPLCHQLIGKYYQEDPLAKLRHQVKHVSAGALGLLQQYEWPGNVRELRNVIFGSLVTKRSGDELLISDLPEKLVKMRVAPNVELVDVSTLEKHLAARRFNLKLELEKFEKLAVQYALQQSNGNAAAAAQLLGEVGRGSAKDPGGTVRNMMKRLGV